MGYFCGQPGGAVAEALRGRRFRPSRGTYGIGEGGALFFAPDRPLAFRPP